MDYREKVQRIFLYLLSLKNVNEKTVKNVHDYDKLYWEEEFFNLPGCTLNKNPSNDFWIEVNKKCKKLYDDFFELYQENEKHGENFEIICGYGLLCWDVNKKNIVHPVLETRMKIEFNALKRAFDLVPSGNTKFQSSIFEDIENFDIKDSLEFENKINNMNLDPRIKDDVRDIFKNIMECIDPKGEIKEGYFSKDKIQTEGHPVLYNTFVVFVRKNSMKLWQNEINNILCKIKEGFPIPEPIKLLVGEDCNCADKNDDPEDWSKISERVLFPLPANSEQKEIIKRISHNCGVVMQGPPGTGKSHTIVNLICHLLAYGKRILVTSQTDRALRVLTKKIPDEIKPLCISLLGNDSESFKELSESVRKITNNLSSDPRNISKDIEALKRQLGYCVDKQKLLYIRLKEVQDLENQTISYSGKKYSLIDAAKWVKNYSSKYSWIKDTINIKNDMPVSKEDFEVLKDLLGEISREEKLKFDSIKTIIDKLPKEEEIKSFIDRYKELKVNYKEYEESIKDWHIPCNDRCNYDELLNSIEECENSVSLLKGTMWENVFKNYDKSDVVRQVFRELYYKSQSLIMIITKISRELRSHKIEMPEEDDERFVANFEIVYKVLEEKKKFGKLFKIMHPECAYIFSKCIVDGKQFEGMDQAIVIKLFLQKKSALDELENIWENTIKDYNKNSEIQEDIDMLNIQENLNKLGLIVDWNDSFKSKVISKLGKIAITKPVDWYDINTYSYLESCVKNLKRIRECNELKIYFRNLDKLMSVVKKDIGDCTSIVDMPEDSLNESITMLSNIKQKSIKINKINSILDRMSRMCPNTVKGISDNWGRVGHVYNDIEKAWRWAQWNNLLQKIKELNPEKIEEDLEREKIKEKLIVKELVAKSTWYNQILSTTESQKRSLFSWMQAVKRIGKGRGKLVSKYRKIAQDEMEKCKDAIPVWIMPLNRVIENIKLTSNQFDLIIFDESSQSDIFSLCALMRAKRAVIVGDDKQISPEVVGIDHRTVSSLIDKYLDKIPDKQWFDLQTSLYDTAMRIFPNRLMLKEHFRCVPEIIGFSNNNVYSGEIRPLRYPTLKETFYPPVKSVRVNGKRSTTKPVNTVEAEALVDQILRCCGDQRYYGMTIGVISLLGEAQANLIEGMLRQKLGVEEMIKRRIICGDAYSFQGDERDIIFLSMVISKDVKFAPLSRDADIRRFNVASSRARNQMWLFHSVDLEDLNSECVRYSLLEYFLNYNRFISKKESVQNVFQSAFQRDVYTMIRNRGYKIIPEIKIGRYNIDFMIEGDRNRVAIVCDGDSKGLKYSFKENIERQLDLERVGWTFLKIRGSQFYMEPEKVVNKLFKKLDALGIKPGCAKKDISEQKNLKVV